MPLKDADARREYLRKYKERNRDHLNALSRESYRRTHPPKQDTAWSVGHSNGRYCRTCGGKADNKPAQDCTESRHQERWTAKAQRNNAYRRERRAQARAQGTCYRKGRGNEENRRSYNRRRHEQLRERLFKKLEQEACVRCGFSDPRALQFDHINGGGRKHRSSLASGTAYFAALDSMPADEFRSMFQVLCANCNCIKREERQEWRVARGAEQASTEKN